MCYLDEKFLCRFETHFNALLLSKMIEFENVIHNLFYFVLLEQNVAEL